MRHLKLPDPQRVIACLRETSAEDILPRFRSLKAGDVMEKGPDDPVTVADIASEKRLTRMLAGLLPGSVVVAEEAVFRDPTLLDLLKGDRPVWLIDPIGGTKTFLRGEAGFGIYVSLLQSGITLAGWVHDPVGGETSYAALGEGAWEDGRRIAVAPAAGVGRPPSTEDRRATTRAPSAPASGADASQTPPEAEQPKKAPINLLAKLEPETKVEPETSAGTQDVARSAETASGGAELQPAIAAPEQGEAKPIKTALAPATTAAPGQCEHRLVCLPGTPKPTLMLMCPGKGGGGKDGKATVAGDAPVEPQGEAASPSAADAGQPERQETATSVTAAATAAPTEATATVEATAPEPIPAAAPASAPAPVLERGVADWNWSYDPAKQL